MVGQWESEVLARIDGAFAPKLIHYSAGDLTELPVRVMAERVSWMEGMHAMQDAISH